MYGHCRSSTSNYMHPEQKGFTLCLGKYLDHSSWFKHRARMSDNLIRRGLDPFKVVIRKLVCSFRSRIIQSNNVLLETIVGSMHFMHSKLTRKWNAAVLNLRP